MKQGNPHFQGFCLCPTWPGGCIQLSEGAAAKLGLGGLIVEEYLEVPSVILTLYKHLLYITMGFFCCIANINPEYMVHGLLIN